MNADSAITLVKSALPSASIMILSSVPTDLLQASITNASLTATHAMVSTPLDFSSSAFSRKPGKCFKLQVGVKAPGTPIRTTFQEQRLFEQSVSRLQMKSVKSGYASQEASQKSLLLSSNAHTTTHLFALGQVVHSNSLHVALGIKVVEFDFPWHL